MFVLLGQVGHHTTRKAQGAGHLSTPGGHRTGLGSCPEGQPLPTPGTGQRTRGEDHQAATTYRKGCGYQAQAASLHLERPVPQEADLADED